MDRLDVNLHPLCCAKRPFQLQATNKIHRGISACDDGCRLLLTLRTLNLGLLLAAGLGRLAGSRRRVGGTARHRGGGVQAAERYWPVRAEVPSTTRQVPN